MKTILLVLILLGSMTTQAQRFIENEFATEIETAITTFYSDCQGHGIAVPTHFFQVVVKSMKDCNSKVIVKDGLWKVYIDKDFYEYYKGTSSIYTLVYHTLGKSVLGLQEMKGNHIMNPERVYFKFTQKKRKQVFEVMQQAKTS